MRATPRPLLLKANRDDVAIVKSATEAFGLVAWWVQPLEGTNIVTIDIEHPSTAYPWLRVARETGAEARLVRVGTTPRRSRSRRSPSTSTTRPR